MKRYLLLLGFFTSCIQPKELESTAYYYIVNEGSDSLRIEAEQYGSGLQLEQDTILPLDTTFVFTAFDGSGGHVLPSNFFSAFKVFSLHNGQDSLIYSGVKNNDWNIVSIAANTYKLNFYCDY